MPNPKEALFVRALVKEGANDNAILVPQQGVIRDVRGNPAALVMDGEGKVGQRMLTLDRAIGTGGFGGMAASTFLLTSFAPLFHVSIEKTLGKIKKREASQNPPIHP